jgi:ArsR family transcriptional regulator
MTSTEEMIKAARVFNAMGNLVRLRILRMLVDTKKPIHIKGVARSLKMDYAAIYRHVSVLHAAKLIEIYEVGRSRVLTPVSKELVEDLVRKAAETAR